MIKFNCIGFVDRRTDELKALGDSLERRREIPVLQPITVTPIQRPIYYSWHIRDYARWVEDNQQELVDYWNLLMCDGAGPLGEDDFFIFCCCQHEAERDRMEELKRCYGSAEL